jgi:hypothetical protein
MRGTQYVPSAALVCSFRYVRKCCAVTGVCCAKYGIFIGSNSPGLPGLYSTSTRATTVRHTATGLLFTVAGS